MGPAQDNEPATAAKSIGQVVDVAGVGGVARDSNQVGSGVEILEIPLSPARLWQLVTKPR